MNSVCIPAYVDLTHRSEQCVRAYIALTRELNSVCVHTYVALTHGSWMENFCIATHGKYMNVHMYRTIHP